ncbi:MAG: hypothetical protein WCF18_17900 [Chthoniobacteraceae bacterium]
MAVFATSHAARRRGGASGRDLEVAFLVRVRADDARRGLSDLFDRRDQSGIGHFLRCRLAGIPRADVAAIQREALDLLFGRGGLAAGGVAEVSHNG